MHHGSFGTPLGLFATLLCLAAAGCAPATEGGASNGGSHAGGAGATSAGGSQGAGGASGGNPGVGGSTASMGGFTASMGGSTASMGGVTASSGGSTAASTGGSTRTGGSTTTTSSGGSNGGTSTSASSSGGSGMGGSGTGGGSTGGATARGGTTATGGTTAGGTTATGGTSGRGGTTATGGTSGRGGTTAMGGATATGGTAGRGGTTSAGGSATGGSTSTQPAGKVFSQCRFHFGTIDSKATSGGASLISQLDFFTPGWMMGTFNQGYVCTEAKGSLAGLVPVDVTYIAANYVKNQNKLCDCNVSGCSGGTLCTYGAQYITQDWATILSQYTSNSTGFAGCLGGSPIIFEMEPDWYQYYAGGQTQAWTPAQAGTNMTALVNALKSSLPNAAFSMDISPWIPNNGSSWYTNFNMSLFTFINTSGGGTDANNTKIRSSNAMTWAGVHQVTGKPILADTGYGAAGSSAGEDTVWNVAANINARIADGVISISQYNPGSSWGNTISSIRSQLNTPSVCP